MTTRVYTSPPVDLLSLLELFPGAMLIINANGKIVGANDGVLSFTGYGKKDMIGKTYFEINPHVNLLDWRNYWNKLKTDESAANEEEFMHAGGHLYPVRTTARLILIAGDEWCFLRLEAPSGSSQFTEKPSVDQHGVKNQQEAIIDLAYHTLNQSNDLIFWIDPEGSFDYFNKAAFQQLGYDRQTLAGLKISDLNPEFDRNWLQKTWKALKKDKHAELETEISTQGGQRIPISMNLAYVQGRDREKICVICRDISTRKKKERELEEAFSQIQTLKEKLEQEKTYLREEVAAEYNFNNIISKSANYQRVLHQVSTVASTDATVLILGETGTGKELLARAIHSLSERDDKPFVKINCAALPEHLIESELFGHEKGAFTGAFERKVGRFELADSGTIFLDEIGELPLELQVKLLRVIQEGQFERLGNPHTISVDVRILAATNRNLEQEVGEGRFREDLYYRLNVFPIYNIPLRERKEDIPLLVQHFMKQYSKKNGRSVTKIPKRGMDQLMQYEFPGNIRELQNMTERAVILSPKQTLNLEAVIPKSPGNEIRPGQKNRFLSFEEMQRGHIIEALERTHWQVTGEKGAAKLLGLKGKTLASKMRKLGINRDDYLDL